MARYRWDNDLKQIVCYDTSTGRGSPDVYFKKPYWDENIASEEYPGAKFITSRREKQYWLDKCNLREAGDRIHGMNSFDKISHRHAMESLEKPRRLR